jgi:threonine dehydrogenase-like Zn-dependent dehydrogenase
MAEAMGAIALDASEAKAVIEEQTRGRMCDSVVECVGADPAIHLSLKLAKAAGTVSCIGVNQTMDFKFPMALAFIKNLTFRTGTCSAGAGGQAGPGAHHYPPYAAVGRGRGVSYV